MYRSFWSFFLLAENTFASALIAAVSHPAYRPIDSFLGFVRHRYPCAEAVVETSHNLLVRIEQSLAFFFLLSFLSRKY